MWRGFYAIVDPASCGDRDPLAVAEAILEGGCAVLQLRAKTLDDRSALVLSRALAERCRRRGVPFVVNDRADLALLAGADGLHLGQSDISVADARRLIGARPVGVSTHDRAQVDRALADGADLIGFGPIFPTQTKDNPDPVVGVERLREVCLAARAPVVAIGGITVESAGVVAAAGAQLVAAIAAVCGAADPARAARALHEAAGGAPA